MQNPVMAWPDDHRLFEVLDREGKQGELARHLGIDSSAISHWRKDKGSPDPRAFKEACELLGVSADYLLGLSDIEATEPEKLTAEQLAQDFAADLRRAVDQAIATELDHFHQKLRAGQSIDAEEGADLRRHLEADQEPSGHAAPRKRKRKRGG